MANKQNPSLWQFCLDYYQQPGIAQACINLQDSFAIKINIWLLCLFAEHRGLGLTTSQCKHLHQQREFFHQQYLMPLRELRKQRAVNKDASYQSLLQHELSVEQLEVLALQAWFDALPSGVAAPGVAAPGVAAPGVATQGAIPTLNQHNIDVYWRCLHPQRPLSQRQLFVDALARIR